jgi:hypothetical protein
MKIKFITSIYSDLYGTEFGGRMNRHGHYRFSLLSLLKMTDSDFLCYTSERELPSLEDFFYREHNIDREKLKFQVFDIAQTKFKELINQYKNIEETKKSDRCVEIQYSKFHWWWNEDQSYDYYYWIDAGLSHCGLIPNKYLSLLGPNNRGYYESNLFNNEMLHNLIKVTGDKFLIIGKENNVNFWSGTVNPKWYKNFDRSIHVIGGLFGGKKEYWTEVVQIFEDYVENIISEDKGIPHEENVMSLMRCNHSELFSEMYFEIWNHIDAPLIGHTPDYYGMYRSFYKMFEELNPSIING